MTAAEFEVLFDRRVAESRRVLVEKAKEYACGPDRLYNFKETAAQFGGPRPRRCGGSC